MVWAAMVRWEQWGAPLASAEAMPDPAEAAKMLKGGSKKSGKDDIDFDAIEKALSGQGPMPPGLGGLPGLGRKK